MDKVHVHKDMINRMRRDSPSFQVLLSPVLPLAYRFGCHEGHHDIPELVTKLTLSGFLVSNRCSKLQSRYWFKRTVVVNVKHDANGRSQ